MKNIFKILAVLIALSPLSVQAANVTVPSSPGLGSLLYGKANGNYATLTVGANGDCLKVTLGVPAWGSCGTGGGGGTDGNWSFFNGSGIRLATTSNQVLIGASSTTTLNALEVIGRGYFSTGILAPASSTIHSLSVTNGTTTNATTTKIFSTTASSTSLFSLNATTTSLGLTGITSSLLKTTATGGVTAAISGTDYEVPLTFGDGLTRTANDVDVDTTQNITILSNLTSNGFVKTSGGNGTLSVDTTTYESGLTAGDGLTRTGNDFDCDTASGSVFGCLSSADWTTFNNKGSGTVTAVSVTSANGFAGSSSGGATPALTLSTSITGVLKGNGTAISAAANGTDYTLISATTCGGTDKVSAISASGAVTCTADSGGSGGTGNVATSTAETAGQLPYWTSTNGTPATLGSVATTTVSCSGDASCTPFTVIGSSPITISSTGGAGGSWATTSSNYYNSQFRDWSIVAGSLRPTTTLGVLISASSTIGNGAQNGGLTISGGATTTGNLIVSGGATVASGLTVSAGTVTFPSISISGGNIQGNSISSVGFFNNGSSGGSNTYIRGSSATNGSLSLISTNSGSASGDFINFSVGVSGATEAMRIISSGNVGIGTSTPAANLSIAGRATQGQQPLFLISSTTAAYATTTKLIVDSQGRVAINPLGTNPLNAQFNVFPKTGSGISDDLIRFFNTGGSQTVGINASGVYTGINIDLNPGSGATGVNVNQNASGIGYNITAPAAATANMVRIQKTGRGIVFAVDRFGQLSIGSSTPSAMLSITSSSTASTTLSLNAFSNQTADILQAWRATNTKAFVIQGNGYVGVGTSTPFTGLSIGLGNGSSTQAILVAEHRPATSTSMTIDWKMGNTQNIRLGNAAMTVSFSNFSDGGTLKVLTCNPPTGTAGAVTWGTEVLWSGGTAPTQTTTAQKCDVWSFIATQATSTLKIFGTMSSNF